MLSERTLDGVERSPAQFFRRAHPTDPRQGGAAKDPVWNRRDQVQTLRVLWATLVNTALAQAEVDARVDPRRLDVQGQDHAPEPKLGATPPALLRRGQVTPAATEVRTLRQSRAALARVEAAVTAHQAPSTPQGTEAQRSTRPRAPLVSGPAGSEKAASVTHGGSQ
ncbi:MAG: MobA/MobL family protein [Candidatus Tectimicrobiota bacterium]